MILTVWSGAMFFTLRGWWWKGEDKKRERRRWVYLIGCVRKGKKIIIMFLLLTRRKNLQAGKKPSLSPVRKCSVPSTVELHFVYHFTAKTSTYQI